MGSWGARPNTSFDRRRRRRPWDSISRASTTRAARPGRQGCAKIGSVAEVFLDRQTGVPAPAAVRTGLFGHKHTLVPIALLNQNGEVQVRFAKDHVKGPSKIEAWPRTHARARAQGVGARRHWVLSPRACNSSGFGMIWGVTSPDRDARSLSQDGFLDGRRGRPAIVRTPGRRAGDGSAAPSRARGRRPCRGRLLSGVDDLRETVSHPAVRDALPAYGRDGERRSDNRAPLRHLRDRPTRRS